MHVQDGGARHLGEILDLSPNAQGFDEFLGHKVGCIDNYSHFYYWKGPNRHDLWKDETEYFEDGTYFPDMIVREACRFLEENRNSPFFLFLPFIIRFLHLSFFGFIIILIAFKNLIRFLATKQSNASKFIHQQ